jgi:SSS family solute:Na+ symporter
VTSLVVKVGAVLFILLIDPQFSIDLQLIGGVIILQTLPSVAIGLFTRWFHKGGLIAGWIGGMGGGLLMLYNVANPATKHEHFGGSAFALSKLGIDTPMTIYAGFLALLLNLIVAVLGTIIARALKTPDGPDGTAPAHYTADEGDPRVKDLDLSGST